LIETRKNQHESIVNCGAIKSYSVGRERTDTETQYKDRFGETICSGHTLRPFQEDHHGRPVIVRFKEVDFVVDIPDYKNDIALNYYIDDAMSSGWELEIVQPYPYAEPYNRR
jgi:hypothetical protein